MGSTALAPARYRPRVDLGDRDLALFAGLFEARVMLREQIAELFFSGSYEAAAKRLQKLLAHGYIRERTMGDRRGAYLPRFLSLAEPAFVALREAGRFEERFTWERVKRRLTGSVSSLAHDLDVVDLWIAFAKATHEGTPHRLKRFSTWPYLYQLGTALGGGFRSTVLLPDAFAVIASTDDPALPPVESALFFEWDRSTEWRSVLREKASAYDRLYRSGAFAERAGGTRADVADYPFRVVFAVKNEERRNNLLEELARPNGRPLIHDQFWCTTWDEILADPFGPIYLHVADYQAATRGTMYDPARYVTRQRVLERDELVRSKGLKRGLLA